MGGRLLDWLGQGDMADRPDPATMIPTRVPSGSAALYFANDVPQTLCIFDETGPDWFEIDMAAVTSISFQTLPDVDWSTPPTDGQIFKWDNTAGKFVPVDLPASFTTESIQDLVGAMFANGSGMTVSYDDPTGIITVTCNLIQYTDEMAMDAIAAMIAAGTHSGISISYNDAGNAISFTVDDSHINTLADARIAAASIDALSDVDTTTGAPADGDALVWSAAGSKWIPGAVAGGGGGSDWTDLTFSGSAATMWGSAQTFESDQTLTLAAGDKIEIQLLINRTVATQIMVGISPDANKIYMGRVQSADDNNALYYYLTSGGSSALPLANAVANGDFATSGSWSLGSGVSIASGHASASGASNIISQSGVLTNGLVYQFSFDYTMSSGNSIRITNGTWGSSGAVYTTPTLGGSGTITGQFTAGGTNFNLEAVAAVFSGTIDNVIVSADYIANPTIQKHSYSGSIDLRLLAFVGSTKTRLTSHVDGVTYITSIDANNVNLAASTNKVYVTIPSGDFTKVKQIRYRINA